MEAGPKEPIRRSVYRRLFVRSGSRRHVIPWIVSGLLVLGTLPFWLPGHLFARASRRIGFPVQVRWSVPGRHGLVLHRVSARLPAPWPEVWVERIAIAGWRRPGRAVASGRVAAGDALHGRVNAELEWEGGFRPVRVLGRLIFSEVRLRHPLFGEEAADLLPVTVFVELRRGADGWRTARLRLRHGALKVRARVVARARPEGIRHELTIEVPRLPADGLLGSIPGSWLGEWAGSRWEGAFSGALRMDFEREITGVECRIDQDLRLAGGTDVFDVSRLAGAFDYRVRDARGGDAVRRSGPGTASWVSLDALSSDVWRAFLMCEDRGFFEHGGVDPAALALAIKQNLHRRALVFGGSTITQQLARTLWLDHERSMARKIQEVLLAFHLEHHRSKLQILELYLNTIEFGPGLHGLDPAARAYFNKPAPDLTRVEALALAAMLPAPQRLGMADPAGPDTAFFDRMEDVLHAWHARGWMDAASYADDRAALAAWRERVRDG